MVLILLCEALVKFSFLKNKNNWTMVNMKNHLFYRYITFCFIQIGKQ